MAEEQLHDEAIRLGVSAHDWREAIEAAGEALVASGATAQGYAGRMIQVVEEFGAYIVIAPGLALAHARPGPDVLDDGLAVVTLVEPVTFGHPHNDPVSVVLALAATTLDHHVGRVAALANVFNDPRATATIAAATTPDDVRAVFAERHPLNGTGE